LGCGGSPPFDPSAAIPRNPLCNPACVHVYVYLSFATWQQRLTTLRLLAAQLTTSSFSPAQTHARICLALLSPPAHWLAPPITHHPATTTTHHPK